MSDVKPPVTEIVSFPVIKGLKPGEGQEKMFGVDAGEGFQSGHYGFEVEDESIFHWALSMFPPLPPWGFTSSSALISGGASQTGIPTTPM